MKLREIVERLGCRLEGDGDIEIHRVAGIEDAGAGDLTFFQPLYAWALKRTAAPAVIAGDQAEGALRGPSRLPSLSVLCESGRLSPTRGARLGHSPPGGCRRQRDYRRGHRAFAVVGDGARIARSCIRT